MLKNVQIMGMQQKLSPQLIQSQILLAIPTLALEQEMKLQLESNPLLEEVAEAEQETEETESESEQEDKEAENSEEESYDIEEWYDYSGFDEAEGYKSPEEFAREGREETENRTDYLLNKAYKQRETPLDQLHRAGLEDKYVIIGEEIIGSLGDDGYLRDSLEDILNDVKKQFDLDITLEDVEYVLKIIQTFDPVGIASRNLQECLNVQIQELEIDAESRELCLKLINENFDDFKSKHYEKIARTLKIPLEKVNTLFEIINRLNPVPGNPDPLEEKGYIYPDFIVSKTGDDLQVELTDDFLPVLRISRRYVEMIRSKKTSKKAKEFLKSRLEAGKWFISSIQSRRETMMKVMKAIVDRQKMFFLKNGENLKPMFEKDIASDINMDISTVSRTVRNKYVQTDFGTFELKYFFSNPIQTESGEDVSSKMVKEKIKELISNEDKQKPFSDDKLTQLLNEAGFPIARRTASKYREALKIPKATLRRKILV
jgi:RNA polymerase sigma-54 factor